MVKSLDYSVEQGMSLAKLRLLASHLCSTTFSNGTLELRLPECACASKATSFFLTAVLAVCKSGCSVDTCLSSTTMQLSEVGSITTSCKHSSLVRWTQRAVSKLFCTCTCCFLDLLAAFCAPVLTISRSLLVPLSKHLALLLCLF